MLISELIHEFQLETTAPLESDFEIRGVKPLSEAGVGDLSFLSNPKYRDQAAQSGASALLIKEPLASWSGVQILCREPYVTLALIMQALYPERVPAAEIHPSAVVHPSARIGEGCYIGPFCLLEAEVEIGAGTVLVSHVSVAAACRIGRACKLYPQVVLYGNTRIGDGVRIHANVTIGGDGFGYAQDRGRHVKVPQIGGVRIGDHVEIGSNTSIDRGALKDTLIGAGTKIDNQVQVGHGVVIGEHCILVSQTGISGSATLGNYVVLAGKVGVNGHVFIGDQIVVMGDSVVTKSLEHPGRYAGNPAIPHIQYQRQLAHLRSQAKLQKRVKHLEQLLSKEPDHE